jgi:hypothetical protein
MKQDNRPLAASNLAILSAPDHPGKKTSTKPIYKPFFATSTPMSAQRSFVGLTASLIDQATGEAIAR